jgi:MFS family permease
LSFGSFLAFYLADLGWSKQNVGLALTAGGLAAVAAQIPGDALADAVRWKRALAASGFVLIAAAALILALRPDFSLVYGPNHVFMTRLEQFVRVRPRPVPVWDPGSSRPGSLIVCGAATVATGNP